VNSENPEASEKPIWSCGTDDHPDSLIYFDKVYGTQCSWEICQVCGEKHHVTELKSPEDDIDTTHGYYDSHGYHYYSSGNDM